MLDETPLTSTGKQKAKTPIPLSTNPSSHPSLKLTGIEHLKPPGEDSNYLDWRFVINYHFKATGVADTLFKVDLVDCPVTWHQDNVAACAGISRTIHAANAIFACTRTMPLVCGNPCPKRTRTPHRVVACIG
jgi:hypothetical protein